MAIEKLIIAAGEGVVKCSPAILSSIGLGSCVAVAFFDTQKYLGGLMHILLPGSRQTAQENIGCQTPVRPPGTGLTEFVYSYADTGIIALLQEITARGSARQNIVAKIAGGAKMFIDGEPYETSIGGRNVHTVKHLLKKEKIPLVGEDTGGHHGRNVDFHLDSGRFVISAVSGKKREI